MKIIQLPSLRILAAMAVSITLMTGITLPAQAESASPHDQHNWTQHHQEQVKTRLAKMAKHLDIQSSQQDAWQTYANAVEASSGAFPKKPDTSLDAAAIARHRADWAAIHAQKLAQIADATAKLQAVLTPEQGKKFDEMARHFHHHKHHH